MTPTALPLLVREMPKAELHVHFDGAVRTSTALRLARSRGIEAAAMFAGMAAALTVPDEPGTEADLLTRFEIPVRLMQEAEALREVTRGIGPKESGAIPNRQKSQAHNSSMSQALFASRSLLREVRLRARNHKT